MPRNILALPPKRTPSLATPFAHAVRAYISQNYTDTHPDAFAGDISRLCYLRDHCSRLEVHVSSIELALRYHAQLVFFSTKFPANIGIAFPWSIAFPTSLPLWTSVVSGPLHASTPHDASTASASASASASSYATSDTVAHPDLIYERASLLFSLASLYSALGTAEGRGESESIKRAIASFQHAAGIFDHIRDALLPDICHLKPQSPDLNASLLECLRDLMLAQAQECFWQKAVLDCLKNNTIAKLAERVSELYAASLDRASFAGDGARTTDYAGNSDDATRPQLPWEWINHMTVKRWHFAAAAQFRKSADDLAANRYGDELGRLKVAEGHVKRALETFKRGVSDALLQDLKSLQQIIQTNVQRGTKDNDLIYLEPVTTASNLPPIVAAAMVKPVLPTEVANAISLLRERPAPALGKPLFAELVSYGVHLAISIYDDRRDSLVREQIAERRDELDGIAQSTLQSLNLPGSLQALEQPMGLPPSLLRRHEEVASEGGIDRLHSIADDVARIARTDADMLSEAFSILDQEQREDEQVRSTFTQQRWPRPPSHEAAADLKAQGETYAQTLQQARASDAIVRQKLEDWNDLIGVLSGGVEDLEAFIPSTSLPASSSQSDAQIHTVRSLRASLEHLDDLLDSRAACLAECRSFSSSDDVRPLVLQHTATLSSSSSSGVSASDFEDLFDGQLAKYDKFRQEMDRSAKEQEQVLDEIKRRNEEFREARKMDVGIKRRQKALQNLDVAYGKYRELASNLVEGLEFYNGLAKLLSAYRQDVKEWHRARQIDIQNLTIQFSGTSLSSVAAQQSPKRGSTRLPSNRAQQETERRDQPIQQQQQQPNWGAFPGGEIRFGN